MTKLNNYGDFMAKIKGKDLDDLSTWNEKELRKLKINLNNRIQTLQQSVKPKELPDSNPLSGLGIEESKSLLERVFKAEKKLSRD